MAETNVSSSDKEEVGGVRWLPLESNPEVMTSYLQGLGVGPDCSVCDVLGLDSELLAMVPRPVLAVLLLYPLTDKAVAATKAEDERIAREGQTECESLVFMRQSIGNACGTVALVHALANNTDRIRMTSGSLLPEFFRSLLPLTPDERAAALEKFAALEVAHETACHHGQTDTPSREHLLDTHFIAFVQRQGHLYELDGRRARAVNHGVSSADTLLEDSAAVIRRFMQRDPEQVNFSVLALTSTN